MLTSIMRNLSDVMMSALSIMMVPIIISTTDNMLSLVPQELREAGIALGGSKHKIILQIVLKAAKVGITTGILLANAYFTMNMNDQFPSLTVSIYNLANYPDAENRDLAWVAAFVLTMIGPSGCGKSTLLRALNRMHDLYPGNEYKGKVNLLNKEDDNYHDILTLKKENDLIKLRQRVGMIFQKPLDPILTGAIEELISELKKELSIVIVTHNLQQAGRLSDYTAFIYLGELIEYNKADRVFLNPEQKLTEDYVTGRFG